MRNIENILSNKRTRYNIDGTKSDETKRVGFCTNTIHKGYLTKRLMDEHQCLEKNCKCFIKYEKNITNNPCALWHNDGMGAE